MLCSRFLKPPHSSASRPHLQATERAFDLVLAAYAFTLRQTLRFHPVAMIISVALVGRHRLPVRQGADGVHPERGHRPAAGADRRPAGRRLRGDDGASAARPPISSPPTRTWRRLAHDRPGGNQGRMFIELKPREERDAHRPTRSSRNCGRSWRGAWRPGLPAESAAHPHRGQQLAQHLPVHAAESRHGGAVRGGADARGGDADCRA